MESLRPVAAVLAACAFLEVMAGPLVAGDRSALVIGVRQYDRNQLRNLPFAETDADAVAEKLKAIGFRRVVVMTQSRGAEEARFLPTAANIRKSIDGFLDPRVWEEDDTAVIVLAGHGVQFKGDSASWFCPMDAQLGDKKTLIGIDDIYQKLDRCPAAFKLLIADCCRDDPQSDFSRARSEVQLESVTRPQRAKPPGGVAAFFSCSAGERAYESPSLSRGVFTHFLLKGLSEPGADVDADGRVDFDELVRFTKRSVSDYVRDEFGESTIQVPEMVGRTRGLVPLADVRKSGSGSGNAQTPPRPAGQDTARAKNAGTVSFTKDIAPFVVKVCHECHGGRVAEGNYRMDTYDGMMANGGLRLVTPGDPDKSELFTRLSVNDQSPYLHEVTSKDYRTLKTWIQEGAKFDGANAARQLKELVPAGNK